MKRAFTMLELVFVIVVIGILSAIAIPRFAATRDDAVISRARATVGAIRSAIATERQKRVLKGDFTNILATDIPGLLDSPMGSGWSGLTFTFPDGSTVAKFKLQNNKLKCSGTTNAEKKACQQIDR